MIDLQISLVGFVIGILVGLTGVGGGCAHDSPADRFILFINKGGGVRDGG